MFQWKGTRVYEHRNGRPGSPSLRNWCLLWDQKAGSGGVREEKSRQAFRAERAGCTWAPAHLRNWESSVPWESREGWGAGQEADGTAGRACPYEQDTDLGWEAIEGFLSSSVTESNSAFKMVILAAVWRMNWKELREDMGKVRDTVSEIWKLLLWNICQFIELAESPTLG